MKFAGKFDAEMLPPNIRWKRALWTFSTVSLVGFTEITVPAK